jgi:N-dimethylarginine dimethylaminohydrolase
MCPPTHFDVSYAINPWMDVTIPVDRELAQRQWEALVQTLRDAGAEVEVLEPQAGLPDLVFTANVGIVDGASFVSARMRHPERRAETAHAERWFSEHGFTVRRLSEQVTQEGAGDALPFGDPPVLLSGYRPRSDAVAGTTLSEQLECPVRSVELVDERLYHIDITFCPLDDRRAMVVPEAWDDYGVRVMKELVPEALVLEPDEAAVFHANSVVVGDTIVMPACSPRVGRQLEAWGFTPVVADVSEFLKAGGGVRCLTLSLDVTLGTVAP